MKEEFVIETIVLPISAELCQELCYESSNCAVFQHSAENCTLLREDYRQDCETAGGPSVSKILPVHSMARANLNKSEVFLTNTTAASKCICLGGPESASIEIPPFRPHFIKFSKLFFMM